MVDSVLPALEDLRLAWWRSDPAVFTCLPGPGRLWPAYFVGHSDFPELVSLRVPGIALADTTSPRILLGLHVISARVPGKFELSASRWIEYTLDIVIPRPAPELIPPALRLALGAAESWHEALQRLAYTRVPLDKVLRPPARQVTRVEREAERIARRGFADLEPGS